MNFSIINNIGNTNSVYRFTKYSFYRYAIRYTFLHYKHNILEILDHCVVFRHAEFFCFALEIAQDLACLLLCSACLCIISIMINCKRKKPRRVDEERLISFSFLFISSHKKNTTTHSHSMNEAKKYIYIYTSIHLSLSDYNLKQKKNEMFGFVSKKITGND